MNGDMNKVSVDITKWVLKKFDVDSVTQEQTLVEIIEGVLDPHNPEHFIVTKYTGESLPLFHEE